MFYVRDVLWNGDGEPGRFSDSYISSAISLIHITFPRDCHHGRLILSWSLLQHILNQAICLPNQ